MNHLAIMPEVRLSGLRRWGACASILVVVLVAGCGGKPVGGAASQVAAKVDAGEVTVHQINHIIQRTPGISAEQAPRVRQEILNRLVDQELLVQRALAQKLDRDPQILQALEASRREVLARAYLERKVVAAARPDSATVDKFFAENPELFTRRRVYRFDEVVLPQRPANWPELQPRLAKLERLADAAQVLRQAGIDMPVSSNVLRASEQLPIELVPKFLELKIGALVIYPVGSSVVIGEIKDFREEAIDLQKARPMIEQFLMNRGRQQAGEDELKRLKESAKVVYLGEFAKEGQVVEGVVSPASAARQPEAAPPSRPADGGRESNTIDRGVKGLK